MDRRSSHYKLTEASGGLLESLSQVTEKSV